MNRTINTIEKDFFLTPHFSLKEMTSSATATQLHITNCPNATQIARLKALCNHVLEPLRNRFGAIRITSGFRSERLNSALCANSLSQHTFGEAADIYVSYKSDRRYNRNMAVDLTEHYRDFK